MGFTERAADIEAMAKNGDIDGLAEAFQSRDRFVRSSVIDALNVINSENTIKLLVHAMRDKEEGVRRMAMNVLIKKGKLAVPYLIEALKDSNPFVRQLSALALGGIGDERAIEPLSRLRFDVDFWVRGKALEALEVIKKKVLC